MYTILLMKCLSNWWWFDGQILGRGGEPRWRFHDLWGQSLQPQGLSLQELCNVCSGENMFWVFLSLSHVLKINWDDDRRISLGQITDGVKPTLSELEKFEDQPEGIDLEVVTESGTSAPGLDSGGLTWTNHSLKHEEDVMVCLYLYARDQARSVNTTCKLVTMWRCVRESWSTCREKSLVWTETRSPLCPNMRI